MRLNVVGFLLRFWFARWPRTEPWVTLRGSSANAEGGWDAYKEAIGGPVGLLVALPGEDHGLWNGTGPSVVKDVFAAPRGGLGGEPSWGSWERSTRLLGHGMP